MTKHESIKNFLEPKMLEISEELGFNCSGKKVGVSILTQYSSKVVKQYLRNAIKEYGFCIVLIKPYSVDDDDINLEMLNFAQSVMDWLDIQNKEKNFPKFPDNCECIRWENVQNMPNLAEVNEKARLAKYMVQCKLFYRESEE